MAELALAGYPVFLAGICSKTQSDGEEKSHDQIQPSIDLCILLITLKGVQASMTLQKDTVGLQKEQRKST